MLSYVKYEFQKLFSLKKKLQDPFLWIRFNCLKSANSVHLATKSSEVVVLIWPIVSATRAGACVSFSATFFFSRKQVLRHSNSLIIIETLPKQSYKSMNNVTSNDLVFSRK